MASARPKKARKKKKPSKTKSLKATVFLVFGLLAGIVLLPTTVLLAVAMLPTFVAAFVDKEKGKTKAITVGAMNLAGSMPFLLELWFEDHSFEHAFSFVMDPMVIIIIYSTAVIGYLIDWGVTKIVSLFLLQRGKARVKAIDKRQKELVERWGKEVSGDFIVDNYGFAVEGEDDPDLSTNKS